MSAFAEEKGSQCSWDIFQGVVGGQIVYRFLYVEGHDIIDKDYKGYPDCSLRTQYKGKNGTKKTK